MSRERKKENEKYYELYGNDYIHFWYSHFKQSNSEIISNTKLDIVKKFEANKRNTQAVFDKNKNAYLSPEEQQFAQDVLNDKIPDLVESFFEGGDNYGNFTCELPHGLNSAQIQDIIDTDINAIENLAEIGDKLNELFKQMDDDSKTNMEEYTNSIIMKEAEKFSHKGLSSHGIKIDTQKDGSREREIIASILGRFNEKFFELNYDGKNISKSMRKLMALAKAINFQDLSSLGAGKYVVRHGDTKEITYVEGNQSELAKEIMQKVKKYLNEFLAIDLEVTTARALQQAMKEFYKEIEENERHIEVIHSGSDKKDVEAFLETDPRLKKQFEEMDKLGYATKKVSKADVEFVLGEDGAAGRLGVTVKKKNKYSIKDNGGQKEVSHLNVQSGSPLYTLLTREGGLNPSEMTKIYNVLLGHPGKPPEPEEKTENVGESDITNTWNTTKEQIKKLVIVDSLMGTHVNEYSYFLVLNRNIYTMRQVIENIASGLESGKTSISLGTVATADKKRLEREFYFSKIAKDDTFSKPQRAAALERSNKYQKKIWSALYDTKIKINLHNLILGAGKEISK